jgi:hypothetical protein
MVAVGFQGALHAEVWHGLAQGFMKQLGLANRADTICLTMGQV